MRARALAGAAVLVLAACSGGAGDRADDTTTSTSSTSSSTTTTEAAAAPRQVDVADDPEEGFFFEEFAFGESVGTGEVVGPQAYRIVQKAEGFRFETLVFAPRSYTREGADATLASIPFVLGTAADVSAGARLEQGVTSDDLFAGEPLDQLAVDAAVEQAEVSPAAFVRGLVDPEVEPRDGGSVAQGDVRLDAGALDVLTEEGIPAPAVRARVLLDGEAVVQEVDLSIAFGFGFGQDVQLRIEYTYGREPSFTEPVAAQIDQTPNVAEEALRAFADTAIVAPSAVPEGLELDVAELLSPAETLEGCTQVSLLYQSTAGADDYLQVFVVPLACAEDFDPAPYDETFGGLPSRLVTTREVVVGETVVQLDSSFEDEKLEAIARSLVPLTADQVIAMVTPVPPPVSPPPADDDDTPLVMEDALRAFTATALIVPTRLPPELRLRRALVDVATEPDACQVVNLRYSDDGGGRSVDIEIRSASCAGVDETDFGETLGGHPSRPSGPGRSVLVESTVVTIAGGLAGAELETAAASLAPTTADALIASVVPG